MSVRQRLQPKEAIKSSALHSPDVACRDPLHPPALELVPIVWWGPRDRDGLPSSSISSPKSREWNRKHPIPKGNDLVVIVEHYPHDKPVTAHFR